MADVETPGWTFVHIGVEGDGVEVGVAKLWIQYWTPQPGTSRCGPPGTRTLNLRIKSPQLCQLS